MQRIGFILARDSVSLAPKNFGTASCSFAIVSQSFVVEEGLDVFHRHVGALIDN